MDSVQASELMARMIRQIDRSYTDEAHIVEMFKLLRGEGYTPEQILGLFRLKRELQLAVEVHGQHPPFAPEVDRILSQLERAIRGSRRSGSRQDAPNISAG
jgi:LPS sulfotransferase NodH